ncbi:MAG TPA: hypothetical protein VM735_08435, partial [Candidatus Kapabacteria bacterium]|nr:hypothetical protein [Candidatus Kapabacteria bacterium]
PEGDLSLFNGPGEQSLEIAAEASGSNPEGDGANAEQSTDPAGRTLLEIVRPVQKKIPLNAPIPASLAEQIAGNTPQPAKKGSGIPAAQSPPMLLTSQKQEETATKQKSAVLEAGFAVEAAEAKVEFRTGTSPRESAPKRDLELAEFSTVDSITPEWSSFDGILETAEVHAPKDVESLEVVQAIRTHVELLRTSGQGKLDVVLRPDSQTQLHLQVERVNGQILVQARCDRGDFLRLEANWSAVQQSLANQGVRVEALQQSPNFQQHQSFNGSFSSAEHHSSSRQEKETKFFERELSVPNHPKKPAASSTTARGWQSWA